ncbi:MAG: type IV pilus biogenesis protein PilP [Proteobacteria bacterium]|nr:type IV pilus biogenesis protein PilP [Pseudomonadota bacterium]
MLKGALTVAATGAILLLGLAAPSAGFAQTGSDHPTATAPLPTVAPASDPAAAAPVGSTTVGASLPGASPGGPLTQPANTPHIVQDAVTGLQKTDPINMDDMIRAQDAINRLDLLLEIEKRQTELKKLRDERNKPVGLSAAIPASALNLPTRTAGASMAAALPRPSAPITIEPPKPSGTYNLKRIVGTSGQYLAILSVGDKTVSARAGETLPDGSKVKSVTLTSVSLVKDRKSKTLTIPSDAYIVRGSQDLME